MRDYAQVRPRFWTGNTGRLLRDDRETQVVALYLITGPHANMIGLYYLPTAYITADTGIPFEGASKALARLSDAGFCKYDQATEVVWIVEMARHQIGGQLLPADKRCKSIHREYMSLPHNIFLTEFFDRYSGAFHLAARRGEGAEQAPSVPLRSQEQEQEQEQETEHDQEQEQKQDTISGYTPEFKQAWALYPARSGSNPKRSAFKAWSARIQEGRTAEQLIDGVRRYAEYCKTQGKTGSEYVQQAKTFFGPDEHFNDPWKAGKNGKGVAWDANLGGVDYSEGLPARAVGAA